MFSVSFSFLVPLILGIGVDLDSTTNDSDIKMQRIISNVRANEKLYSDMDLVVSFEYHVGDTEDDLPNTIVSLKKYSHTVSQDGMMYRDLFSDEVLLNGENRKDRSLYVFDGESSTTVFPNKITNIQPGDGGIVSENDPHTTLIGAAWGFFLPLSTFLEGSKSMKTSVGAGFYSGYWNTSSYFDKEEFVDGMRSVKIRIDSLFGGDNDPKLNNKLISRRFLCLAIDRNYIPIKSETYYPLDSATQCFEYGHNSDWKEIELGIWYPMSMKYEGYETWIYKERNHKLVLADRTVGRVERVDLHPDYPKTFFQKVEIPQGSPVYLLNKDKKIIKSYIQDGAQTSPGRSYPRLLYASLILPPLAFIIVVLSSRRIRNILLRR